MGGGPLDPATRPRATQRCHAHLDHSLLDVVWQGVEALAQLVQFDAQIKVLLAQLRVPPTTMQGITI